MTVRYLPMRLLPELVDAKAARTAGDGALSERERQVLTLLLRGRGVEDIATMLEIAPRTVKFHQANVLQKLGADSRLDLLRVILWRPYATRESASDGAALLVAQAVDGAELRGLSGGEDRRERADRERREGDDAVVEGAHVDGQPVDVIDVRVEPQAEPREPGAEREPGRHAEDRPDAADDDRPRS